ncbi:hypothetical protein EI94DRAFT_1764485 [Lactarius quietus]|nr:hypothetical protein EI94DRAFT_1764485 [Lactarius quietus]
MANLYHSCMQIILGPITAYSETGIEMMSGDGIWRQCHPVFASFVGDYPEQILVIYPSCDYNEATDIYALADGDAHAFHLACRELGQKPVYHPFWEALPLTNIFISITPDNLHQLLQGVFKHLVAWLIAAFGKAEIDLRCRHMPPNHHIHIFGKGISGLSRVTGKEHKDMSWLLLGLVLDLPLPGGQVLQRLITAVRALLDFLFLAQFQSHMTHTIMHLETVLTRFHDNKEVFMDLGVRDHFNLPKIHSMGHYILSIRLFGTTDNYNTEQTERLHVELTKGAFNASNRKDVRSQMSMWVVRREKIQDHMAYIKWWQEQVVASSASSIGPPQPGARSLKMAKHPALKAVSFDDLAYKYGATDFQDTLADFIAQTNHPTTSGAALSQLAADTLIPFCSVPVHHKIKFTNSDNTIVDSIQIRPEQKDACHRIAQVRVVFEIPNKSIHEVFPSSDIALMPPEHLAYVEWFLPIPINLGPHHLLYKVHRLVHHGRWRASIIPVKSILRSVHLFPTFGKQSQRWRSFTVLNLCNTFYINPFSDRDSYMIFS